MARPISTRKMMRMKQLTAETGVTKATVQFYVNEGLIPKPVKTHANMAYYDESHVNAIRLVKELQSKRFLPLSVIKRVMEGEKGGMSVDEIRTLVEIDGKVFTNIRENPALKPLNAAELSKRTGVSREDIRIMEGLGILTPIRKGHHTLFEEIDIRIVECFGKLREAGFTPELGIHANRMKMYWDLMKTLVQEELNLFAGITAGRVPARQLPAMVENAATIANNLMGLFHKKIIVETTRRYRLDFGEGDAHADGAKQGSDASAGHRKPSGKGRPPRGGSRASRRRTSGRE